MIYARLMGGLGNQMFQYAAARRLSLNLDTDLTLDKSYFSNHHPDEVPREYELDCFRLPAKVSEEPIEQLRTNLLGRLQSSKISTIQEKEFTFDPDILRAHNNSFLIGYWQSEKYFIDREAEIRKDFTFVQSLSLAKSEIAQKMSGCRDAVALQIRRGDFAQHHVSSQFHGLVSMDYYREAVDYITKRLREPTFFVVSDDSEWCRKNLKLKHPTIFVEHVPNTGHEDMNLLTQCKHHIIANSSFGWWGAWLGKKPGQIVIAPKNWFKAGGINTSDLLSASWIKL